MIFPASGAENLKVSPGVDAVALQQGCAEVDSVVPKLRSTQNKLH